MGYFVASSSYILQQPLPARLAKTKADIIWCRIGISQMFWPFFSCKGINAVGRAWPETSRDQHHHYLWCLLGLKMVVAMQSTPCKFYQKKSHCPFPNSHFRFNPGFDFRFDSELDSGFVSRFDSTFGVKMVVAMQSTPC